MTPEQKQKEIARWERKKAKPRGRGYMAWFLLIITVIYLADEVVTQVGGQMQAVIASRIFAPVVGDEYAVARMSAFSMISMSASGLAFFYKPLSDRFGRRVFGEGNAPAPAAATEVRGQRTDAMTAKVSWQEIPGAMGCNVRFGIAPDKLYLSHMVYGKQEVLLTGLNAGQCYWIRVDSFGEGGITEESTIVLE